jgi:long-chain acyl-CoA synthetase
VTEQPADLVELLERALRRFADEPLLGTRSDGGSWSWLGYAEFGAQVDAFRAALALAGIGAGDRVAIVADNCVPWAVACYAAYGRRAAFVPMYTSQHPDEWCFILRDCGAKLAVAQTPEIHASLVSLRDRLPALAHVVGVGLAPGVPASWETWLARGAAQPVAAERPKPSDVAGFIYTSGTTGRPKGVLQSHANLCFTVNALAQLFPLGPGDRSLAFLPWAHSFGQICELHGLLNQGAALAINDDVASLLRDAAEVRPTILFAVPRVFNRIYDAVGKQMAARPWPVPGLFRAGIALATARQRGERLGLARSALLAAIDRVLFGRVRERLGGQLRLAISGSAALGREVAEFVDALGVRVYEGYGLTETCPIVSANRPGQRRLGSVGRPVPGVEVQIDHSATGVESDGEIVVRGPNIMLGYHQRPEENAAVLGADGWFRTGDLGRVDADGFLYITGRIKEQYKLENGRYVVPAPLEEQLKLSPYIASAFVYGDNRPHNVALIVPDVPALESWANRSGRTLGDPAGDPAVRELLGSELERLSSGFKGYERPRGFAVLGEDFTTANGLLTPTLKLKRPAVFERYRAEIEALYR